MVKDYEMPNDIRSWGVYVPEEAIERVAEVLKSGWINTGKHEKELRDLFRKKFLVAHCVAVNNGTAALRASYQMLGIGHGDEVVTTPYTFIATNTSLLEQGAIPVFADIRYGDLNVTAETIEEKLTSKTKAIVIVHYAGNPVDLDEIRALADSYNVPLIEDSAHAMGSKYKDSYIGQTGDLVTFSLQAVKIVTSGDGGIIATGREDYYERLQEISWYGVNRDKKQTNLFLDSLPDDISVLGFKYNMNDIIATIAISALDHFDIPLQKRKSIAETYRRELKDLKTIKLLEYYRDRTPNYQIFPIHVEGRERFARYMWDKKIQVGVNNRRNDKYSIFGRSKSGQMTPVLRDLPNLRLADEDTILLPIHFDIDNDTLDYIIDSVIQYDKLK